MSLAFPNCAFISLLCGLLMN